MKDLFDKCERVSYSSVRGLVLLDTCFFINFLGHHKDMRLVQDRVRLATTSFNVEELDHVSHRLNHDVKSKIRGVLKEASILVVDVPVSPGQRDAEREFVNSVDEALLANVHDPSDAVLIAAAIKTSSNVVTRDKHHLFTVKLEKLLKPYGIQVYKDLKFLG